MSLSGYFSITRPLNSLVSGFAALLGFFIATGTINLPSLVLVPVVILITAAGNVINDYFDATIDAVNRPRRPIPSGAVPRDSARSFAIVLFLAGIFVSLFTNPFCILIAIVNSLLLTGYAADLKGRPLVGNLAVSYLSASIFVFGGALAGVDGAAANVPLAVITFFAMLARELLKDAEDVAGDSLGGARTLPMIIGIQNSARIALAAVAVGAGASLLPVSWWGIPYLAGIALVDGIIIFAVLRAVPCTTPACVKESRATSLLKTGFFLSLAVFFFAASFL